MKYSTDVIPKIVRGGYIKEMAETVRIGILGCSDIARRKFIPAVRNARGGFLRAVAGRDFQNGSIAVGGIETELVSYDQLLIHPEIDLVYISLPNHLHELFTLRALENGKHVICEKPLGLSEASVMRMLAMASDRGLLLFENLMFLHHPQHATVKNLVDSGEIGTIKALRSVFSFPVPAAGNIRLVPAMGGGAFHDLARYAVGTAWYFLRKELSRFNGYALDYKGLNMSVHGTALTLAQEVFSFSMAFGQAYESSYEIIGEKGTIKVDRAYTTPPDLANLIKAVIDGRDSSFIVPPADHFKLMIEDVCNMIISGTGFDDAYSRAASLAAMAEQMEKGCHHEGLRK